MGLRCELQQQAFPGWRASLVDSAIETLRFYQPKDKPYWGCFSGGKDSVVIKHLAKLAEVDVEWHYSVTTIDPPELVYFTKREHSDVLFDLPKHNFFTLMVKRGFPTRRARWCCQEYKESRNPPGARLILGVRAAESPRRAKTWKTFIANRRKGGGEMVLPIFHWKDDDIWWFIRDQKLPYCKLYDEGWKRLGCIGCPLATAIQRQREFTRWPRYREKWKKAFEIIWQRRVGTLQRDGREWFGSARFATWRELWEWWKSDESLPSDQCADSIELWS